MDVKEVFTQFCKDVFPEESIEVNIEQNVEEFEAFYPSVVLIVQKDAAFFSEDRIVFGRNLSSLDESKRELIWKNMLPAMLSSFFHGDIKTKVNKISGIIKNLWNASGQENDAVTRILNDEASEGRFKEVLDFILNSRLVKIFTNLIESLDFADFELDIQDPAQLLELIKDPENPAIQKVINKIQNTIKEKVRRGEFNQNVISREIEAIKAKIIGLFGNVFNDALGGRRQGGAPPAVLMGNSPEARRQRMIARLQRKVQEKNSK
uniref:Uncharacterized protein n=1 Tax=viral metagenome TaxID=1070528 RepID=A0A6C0JLJ8_9ZZZZ